MQRKYFEFRGLKLSYLEAGTKYSQKILITHANGYAAGCYKYILKELSKKFHVCALDFAGHGESESTLEFSSWNFFRDQIFAFMDHKGWKTCTGIGHSLGGGSLLRAAETDSSRFGKIIALDPVLIGFAKTIYVKFVGNPMAKVALTRRSVFKNKEQALKIFERHPANRSWEKVSVKDYVEYCMRTTKNGAELCCAPEFESRVFSMAEFAPILELRMITVPVHFILPPRSSVISPWIQRKIVRGNPKSRLERLQKVGHLFPFESRTTTLQALTRCLKTL